MEFTFITSNTGITIPSTTPPEDNQVRLQNYAYFEFVEPVTSLNLMVMGMPLYGVDGLGNPVPITSGLNTVSFPSTTVIGIDISRLSKLDISGDAKLKAVLSWGANFDKTSINITACTELVSVPDYLPASVADLKYMFAMCTKFNQDLSSWDVSNVTDMGDMFNGCTSFNQDLSSWDLTGKSTLNFDYNTPSWTLPKPIF